MQTIRGQILNLVEACLRETAGIEGLRILRNDDLEYHQFPVLHQLDLDSSARVTDRAAGALTYEMELTIEGAVNGETSEELAAGIDALYGAAVVALLRLKTQRLHRAIMDVLEQDMDAVVVRDEDGIAPHALFSLSFTIQFQTSDLSPFALA